MTTPRTRGVRLLTTGAAGALTLSALAVAAPQSSAAGAAFSAMAAPAAASAPVAAPPKKKFKVKNFAQLRLAVRKSNKSRGKDQIILTSNIAFTKRPGRSNDLDIADALVIKGQGNMINAQLTDRVFDIRPGNRVVIKDVTLRNGRPASGESGGAVRTFGNLILKQVKVKNSSVVGEGASGGAIFNDGGKLQVKNSTLSGNSSTRAGGAIETNGGRVALRKSSMIGNDAGSAPGNGGGLHTTGAGFVRLVDSQAVGNVAGAEGGGLWNSEAGAMVLTGSTVRGNRADGAEADQGGGGLYNDGGRMGLDEVIVSGNKAAGALGSGGGILNNRGTLTTANVTKILSNSANRAGGGIEAVGGTTNLDKTALNANTAGEAPGNGGGLHLTGEGDVALTGSDVSRNVATAEGGGLWNSAAGSMVVTDTRISLNSAAGPLADQGGGGLYNDGGSLDVNGGVLDANTATGAAGSGGGILNNGGTLTVDDATVSNNEANRAGGGIESAQIAADDTATPPTDAQPSTTTVTNTDFTKNTVGTNPGNGGAIHLGGGSTVDVTGGTASENRAVEGGGFWNSGAGEMSVDGTTFTNNIASGAGDQQGGGALFNDGGNLTVSNATFTGNQATGEAKGSGGAILNNAGTLDVSDSTFNTNSAQRAGGAIELVDGNDTLNDVDFDGNTTGPTPGNGGAIHAGGASNVTYDGGTVQNNDAAGDGGGLWNGNGTFTATDITFGAETDANSAGDEGADAYNETGGGVLTVNGTVVPPGTGTP